MAKQPKTDPVATQAGQPIPAPRAVRLLREPDIIGDRFAKPPVPALIPISRSTLWDRVKKGLFPKPFKLGPKTTVWREPDIIAWQRAHGLLSEDVQGGAAQ